jgi:hypothetical protein
VSGLEDGLFLMELGCQIENVLGVDIIGCMIHLPGFLFVCINACKFITILF